MDKNEKIEFVTTLSAVTASFFALLDRRQREHQQAEAQARKDREDAKLARLRPWWVDAQQ